MLIVKKIEFPMEKTVSSVEGVPEKIPRRELYDDTWCVGVPMRFLRPRRRNLHEGFVLMQSER